MTLRASRRARARPGLAYRSRCRTGVPGVHPASPRRPRTAPWWGCHPRSAGGPQPVLCGLQDLGAAPREAHALLEHLERVFERQATRLEAVHDPAQALEHRVEASAEVPPPKTRVPRVTSNGYRAAELCCARECRRCDASVKTECQLTSRFAQRPVLSRCPMFDFAHPDQMVCTAADTRPAHSRPGQGTVCTSAVSPWRSTHGAPSCRATHARRDVEERAESIAGLDPPALTTPIDGPPPPPPWPPRPPLPPLPPAPPAAASGSVGTAGPAAPPSPPCRRFRLSGATTVATIGDRITQSRSSGLRPIGRCQTIRRRSCRLCRAFRRSHRHPPAARTAMALAAAVDGVVGAVTTAAARRRRHHHSVRSCRSCWRVARRPPDDCSETRPVGSVRAVSAVCPSVPVAPGVAGIDDGRLHSRWRRRPPPPPVPDGATAPRGAT